MLIALDYHADVPPRLGMGDAGNAVIDHFRYADILDWTQGRGEGLVPTDFIFIDDEGIDRKLP